jgi:hypothetical protein
MDREGLVSVRRSSGEWLFLQRGPNSKAFTLEGEYGECYTLQTDKEVGACRMRAKRQLCLSSLLWGIRVDEAPPPAKQAMEQPALLQTSSEI